ncbi:MAG: hypothetical protein OYL97_15235 [Candidatus Poribacteria bacterium]|nr:hypothetical protein [Candidatus Poribacteria bacterium]
MVYNDFTLETVVKVFQLEIVETLGLFSHIEPIVPRPHFTTDLEERVQLAFAVNTHKAKSEFVISHILFELWVHLNRCPTLFSGIEFNVDLEKGLTGMCDFLISLDSLPFILEAPVSLFVKVPDISGKDESHIIGLGACVAEMIAAQRFNKAKGNEIPCIYGATTSGINWHFLKLEGQRLHIDLALYQITQCDKILGILANMVEQKV